MTDEIEKTEKKPYVFVPLRPRPPKPKPKIILEGKGHPTTMRQMNVRMPNTILKDLDETIMGPQYAAILYAIMRGLEAIQKDEGDMKIISMDDLSSYW